MLPEGVFSMRRWKPAARLALAAWLILLAVICIRCAVQPYKRTLYTTWDRAGGDWQAGRDIYHRQWEWHQDAFRYSPLAAALFVPFHQLPLWLGGVAWRLLNAAVLLLGLAWWLERAAPARLSESQRGLFFIVTALLALGSLNNGQPNLLVIGLLLASLAAAADQHWKTSALCVGLACALKVYPVAMGLLLAVAYPRRFGLWLLGALALVLALPYALGDSTYVTRQTTLWIQWLLNEDARHGWPVERAYRDLWLLVRVAGLDRWISAGGYLAVQLATAAGCAALTVAARLRGCSREEVLLVVLALGSCWMILCGPATESCTYILLAPALAWAILRAPAQRWPQPVRWLPALAGGLLLVGILAGTTPHSAAIHAWGEQPLAALLLAVSYGIFLVGQLRRQTPPAPVQLAARAA